jgi:hypothetical protein
VSSQASELRERKIGITPFDCPRDITSFFVSGIVVAVEAAVAAFGEASGGDVAAGSSSRAVTRRTMPTIVRAIRAPERRCRRRG